MNQPNHKPTVIACFVAYIVQAIVVNFAPLLFVTFQTNYRLTLTQIGLLITLSFGIQLSVDFLSAFFLDRIGYKSGLLLAHGCAAIGLFLMGLLPDWFSDPFVGLLIAMTLYAIGGGLLEVIISPLIESIPFDNKEKAMSLLHSFYSFGQVGVVLLSTLFFAVFGIERWRWMSWLWAVVPLLNGLYFVRCAIPETVASQHPLPRRKLFFDKTFWLFVLMMLCAGAAEQAVSQWASAFAEQGLGISKTAGDLAGPLFFAAMMGLSRVWDGVRGETVDLTKFIRGSVILSVAAYAVLGLTSFPFLSLIACGVCGLSVGILWPGTYSRASAVLKNGGTSLFAFLALAGDVGCMLGPQLVATVSEICGNNLKIGMLSAIIFPLILLVCLYAKKRPAL